MPRTPWAGRPMGRTSSSSNRIALPSWVARKTIWLPSVQLAATSSLGPAGLKKFGHTRQTAGDVLGLRGLPRRLGHQGAGHDPVAFGNDDVRAGRNWVVGQGLALIIEI